MSQKSEKIDPFKTRKNKNQSVKQNDTITPPEEIREAIDLFRECQDQARHFEAESTYHKEKIMKYCEQEFAHRFATGRTKSFKVLGEESMVTYVIQDMSAGLTSDEIEEFSQKWGERAANELIEKDYRSIRFNEKVLANHYDQVVEALQSLPENILSHLFKPMLMKAKEGALEKAKKFAKDEASFKTIVQNLKMRNFIR